MMALRSLVNGLARLAITQSRRPQQSLVLTRSCIVLDKQRTMTMLVFSSIDRQKSTAPTKCATLTESGALCFKPKNPKKGRPIGKTWVVKPEKYTIMKIPTKRTGGRDPATGRVVNKRGGGHKRLWRMVDFKRVPPPAEEPPVEEKVIDILYDPNRSARIALVAGGQHKRYILATMNMRSGDIIKTSGHIGRMAVLANEGDAYPCGALPIGCLVHNVELKPGFGSNHVRAAGTSAQILRKAGNQVIIRLPSKHEISIDQRCMVTVGRLSNEGHGKVKHGKAGRRRWLGYRPSSGLWQRKQGKHGRKIKPLPPIKVFLADNTEPVFNNRINSATNV